MADVNRLRELEEERKLQKSILDSMLAQAKTDEERLKIKKGEKEITSAQGKTYKQHVELLREVTSQVKEIQATNKLVIDSLIQQESSLKSLTGIQTNIGKLDRKRIDMQSSLNDELEDEHKALNNAADLIGEISKLSAEDSIAQKLKLDELDEQIALLKDNDNISSDIVDNLIQQRNEAEGIASLTDKQQKFLGKQIDAYEGIKDAIGGVLETASLLTSTIRGGIGGALIGAGVAGKKLLDTSYQLGGSLLDTSNISTTLFGTVFEDAVGTTKGLAQEFGGLNDVTLQTQLRTNVLAKNLGIGAGEAAKLTGSFARLNNGSQETAQNLIQSTKNLAEQNGLVPSQVMADVANSAEAFASYGKAGGTNIAEAAIAAGKLGVSMSQLTGITDNLLDFESSINAELELGAMLGKNINLDRARALAYEGDIGGAVRETLSSLGGIEEFNKMDIFQKREAAKLLGLSVEEFQKMAANSDKLNKDGSIQLSTYESLTNNAKAFGSQILSAGQGIGGMLIATGQMKDGLGGLGGIFGGIKDKVKGIFGGGKDIANSAKDAFSVAKSKGLSDKQILAGFGGKDAKDMMMKKGAAPQLPDTSVSEKLNKTTGSKGPKASNLLKGAAAILILAAALFVAAKAFQEFGSVTWPAVGMGLASLVGLAGIAYVLGKAQGEMIKGALAVAILGAALIPFAYSMSLIAGLDIGSVMAAAAGLVVFSAAIFGLGALMMTGVGAVVFGAGLVALAGLGASMIILGAGLLVAAAGFQAIGGSMGSVVSLISQVKDVLGGMFQYIAPIAALSLALVGLAGALTMVGVAGIAALPGLMAVAAVGTIAMGVGSLLGFGGEEGGAGGDSALIEEIQALRKDLTDGKVAVYLDGKKVTAGISSVYNRIGSNSYAT